MNLDHWQGRLRERVAYDDAFFGKWYPRLAFALVLIVLGVAFGDCFGQDQAVCRTPECGRQSLEIPGYQCIAGQCYTLFPFAAYPYGASTWDMEIWNYQHPPIPAQELRQAEILRRLEQLRVDVRRLNRILEPRKP